MRFKLTLCLLLANLAVFFLLWRLDQPVVIQTSPPILPPAFADTDIDHILIEDHSRPDAPKRELARTGRDWRIVQPVDWPANEAAVLRLLNDLRFPGANEETVFSLSEVAKTGQQLKDYGLAEPRLTLTLRAGGQQQVVLVGNSTLDGSRIYVRNPADDLIRALPKELLTSLDVPLADLRDPRIFNMRYIAVQGLSVRSTMPTADGVQAPEAAPQVRFVKESGNWRLESPSQAPADTPLVNAVIGQLLALTAERFVEQKEVDAATRRLGNPSLRVELRGETRQTLLLGDKVPDTDPPQYYGKLEEAPTLFVVNAPRNPRLFTVLANAQDDLREHSFMNFDPAKVKAVTLQLAGGNELRLQKLESGADPWRIVAGNANTIPADTAIVQSLLADLHGLQAEAFPRDNASKEDLRTFGFDPPQWKVTLQFDKQDKPVVLLLGIRESGSLRYAKLEDSPSLYQVPPAIFSKLKLDPLYYRNRTLDALPANAQVSSLKLTRLNRDLSPAPGNPVFDFTVTAQKPTLADVFKDLPVGARDALATVRDTLRNFQVAAYQQDAFTERYLYPDAVLDDIEATWTYRLDAGVIVPAAGSTPAQTQSRTYYISRRLGGITQFGGRREPPPGVIFRLTPALIDALAILTESQPPPANAAQILQQMNQPIDPRLPPATNVPAGPAAPPAAVTPASPAPPTP